MKCALFCLIIQFDNEKTKVFCIFCHKIVNKLHRDWFLTDPQLKTSQCSDVGTVGWSA